MWDDPEPSDESWEWSGTFDVPDDEFEEEPLTASGYESGTHWLTVMLWILAVGGVAAVAYLYAIGQFG